MFKLNISFATFVKVFVLAAFLVTAIQSSALAGRQDFVFVNNSGQVVKQLRFSPSNYNNFGDNVLSSPVYHGQRRKIRVNGYSDQYWDFKVVTANGTVWKWYGINLFSVSTITVDGAGTAHY